jgi:hypothetical protein
MQEVVRAATAGEEMVRVEEESVFRAMARLDVAL